MKKDNIQRNEDLMAGGKINTTIEGLDMFAEDWVEQAAEKTNAVKGDTYVQLNRGVLTVNQIDALLDSIPLEFSYIDSNNQFLYYNYEKEPEEMLASSRPENVGRPLGTLHPEQITNHVTTIVQQLRQGIKDSFHIGQPVNGDEKYLVHSYQRIQDKDQNYLGINEHVADLKPIIDWYLEQTKQKLVPDHEKVDAIASPSIKPNTAIDNEKLEEADATTSASLKDFSN